MKSCLNFAPLAALVFVFCFSLHAAGQGPTVDLDDVSLYAGCTLTFGSFTSVQGGTTVVTGSVFGSLDVDSIFAGGSLESNGFDSTRGEVFFNGDIMGFGGPGSIIDGPVTSAAGSIEIGSSTTVNGDVTAGGDVVQDFSFGTINGDVLAGGNVEIDGTVNGNVTHGGLLTLGTFATVTGNTSSRAPVRFDQFEAPALNPSSALQGGANDINLETFEDITLSPGTYGSLNFASSNTVSLTAGTYIFDAIVSDFSLNELALDTSGGEIFIYIDDSDVSLNLIQSINGVRLFAGGAPDVLESNNVTLEVAGSLNLESDFFGTLLVPDGSLSLGGDLTGRAFVRLDVDLSADIVTVNFQLGDADQNDEVNFFDITAFISILQAGDFLEEADLNRDGVCDFFDISPFINALSSSSQ